MRKICLSLLTGLLFVQAVFSQTNLLQNGNMEGWAKTGENYSQLPVGYTSGGTSGNYLTAFKRSATAHSGNNALEMYRNAQKDDHVRFCTPGTELSPGDYTISFRLKGTGNLRWVRCNNATNDGTNGPTTPLQGTSFGLKTYEDWTPCSVSFTVEDKKTFYIHFSISQTSDDTKPFLLDDITLTRNGDESASVLLVSDDTYKVENSSWDANYGMQETMITYGAASNGYNRHAAMKFNLSSSVDPHITKAISNPDLIKRVGLQLYCGADEVAKTFTNSHTLNAILYSGTDWAEDTENIDLGSEVGIAGSLSTTLQENKYYEWDITEGVVNYLKNFNTGAFSLVLKENSNQKDPDGNSIFVPWHTKENESGFAPRLLFSFLDIELLKLSNILIGGTQVDGFDPSVYVYQLNLPYEASATDFPTIEAENQSGTTVEYVNAINLDGTAEERTAQIKVSNAKGEVLVYKIIFNRLPAPNDANLSGIFIDGEPIEQLYTSADKEYYAFNPNQSTYTFFLPYSYNKSPEITGKTNHPQATVEVSPMGVLSGEGAKQQASLTVTAADQTSQKTYTIHFEILPKLDLFLCIGQSNMAGRGYINESLGDLDPVQGVYLMSTYSQMEVASNPYNKYSNIRKSISNQRISPAYSFSTGIAVKTGNPIGMVVNALGGSNIKDWLKGKSLYEASLTRALDAKKWGEYKAIVWHQGESNSSSSAVSSYPNQLKSMVASLREDLGNEALFFVAGELAYWRNEGKGSTAFNEMIRTISSFIDYSAYVPVGDMTDESYMLINEGDPHFSREGNIELGNRYADVVYENVYKNNSSIGAPIQKNNLKAGIKVEGNQLSISSDNQLQCSIVDISGRIIAQNQIKGSWHTSLNKGIYVLSLKNEMEQETYKLIMK